MHLTAAAMGLFLILLLLASFFVTSSSSSSSRARSKVIFLLAGQSNMVGRGGTHTHWDRYIPPQCQADPRILRLNNKKQWEEAHEPLHHNISFKKCSSNTRPFGIGPGMPFASALVKRRDPDTGSIIGLVPCAVGNTEISQWVRGSCLYNRLLTRARASLRDGGVLRGMLWYQGENDAKPHNADKYEDMLKTFFNDVRKDLMSPSLPIIQVALASPEDKFVDKIRRVQLDLKLPNLTCVDARGLQLNADNLHLSTDSQVKLGSMLADAFVKYFN